MPQTAATASTAYPPGPPPRKGLVDDVRYYWAFARDPIATVAGRFATYGDIYYAPSRDGGLYVIKHPDHIRDVLFTHAAAFHKTHTALDRLSHVLGDGLLTTDGAVWKRHRRMIQPAFHKPRLRQYAAMMAGEADALARRWRDGQTEDMGSAMMGLTLRIVSKSLFSHDVEADIGRVADLMDAFQTSLSGPSILPRWVPSPARRRLQLSVQAMDEMMHGLIEKRRKESAETNSGAMGDGPPDLLQMLLAAKDDEGDGGGLSDKEIRDQLVTFFVAGHETTSHALTWTWYLLSQNPRAEKALHDELDAVLGGRLPEPGDLDSLPYTEQVIQEAMRLYPPAYAIPRKAHAEASIGEYAVAPGSEVIIWIYMTHRDARFYPDPEKFEPERFAPDRRAELPKLAYLPFGAGARACIGKIFAMVEAKVIVATLAQRFSPRLAPGQRVGVKPRVTLLPKYGMNMTLRAR